MEESRKRHCWECRRRCLVCDFTRPACKRCLASGTACPGYGKTKPSRLRWVSPGRVTAQKTRRGTPTAKDERNNGEAVTRAAAELSRLSNYGDVLRFEIRTEASAVVQAAEYYNTCIFHDLAPIHELGQNPHIYRILPAHLKASTALPDFLNLGAVCMTLTHRRQRTRDESQCIALEETYYRYRGSVIRSLNQTIKHEHQQLGDAVLVGILTLLMTDAQHGASSAWRWHIKAIQRIITLRGGVRALPRSLEPLLLTFMCTVAFANTTSPSSNLTLDISCLDGLNSVLGQISYTTSISPFQLCPIPLFAEIMKINYIRMHATEYSMADGFSCDAYAILGRISAFSPEQWSEDKPSKEHWLLLGNIYSLAVELYCISSLQSLSVLPSHPALRTRCATRGQLLRDLINESLSYPQTKRFVLWPLIVLGVEAVHRVTMRAFVRGQLLEMNHHTGSYTPIVARAVLKKFWDSGQTDWDSCFDRPYAFPMQILLDMNRILL
ncbi:hypothetical protein FQN49_007789 [Arthroderma sp. PD_2]|nr:hypothetical protein FQN49_007789 [Arthroderma sp. PD_2]